MYKINARQMLVAGCIHRFHATDFKNTKHSREKGQREPREGSKLTRTYSSHPDYIPRDLVDGQRRKNARASNWKDEDV